MKWFVIIAAGLLITLAVVLTVAPEENGNAADRNVSGSTTGSGRSSLKD